MSTKQINVIEISTDSFIAIADNPRQRDTERHANKAKKKHLSKYSPTHRCVTIATINGVPVCKEDGHTRAFLWKSGDLEKPKTVLATCFPVSSMQEAADLYTHFDNQSAVESTGDRFFGASREQGLHFNSALLRRFDFATALKFAEGLRTTTKTSEYELMKRWNKCLVEVDGWDLSKNRFRGSGLLAFAFVAVASGSFSPETIESFYKSYESDAGKKDGKKKDGVQALSEHMIQRQLSNQMTGYENIYDQMLKAYSCLRAWSRSEMIVHVQPSQEAFLKLHAKAKKNLDSGMFES